MELEQNNYLIAAAVCCVLAALAHAGCILFGADWYRFLVPVRRWRKWRKKNCGIRQWSPPDHRGAADLGGLCAGRRWSIIRIAADQNCVDID